MDGDLSKDEETTRKQVLADTKKAVRDNEHVLKGIEGRYMAGVAFAAAGTVVVGVGVIVALLVS